MTKLTPFVLSLLAVSACSAFTDVAALEGAPPEREQALDGTGEGKTIGGEDPSTKVEPEAFNPDGFNINNANQIIGPDGRRFIVRGAAAFSGRFGHGWKSGVDLWGTEAFAAREQTLDEMQRQGINLVRVFINKRHHDRAVTGIHEGDAEPVTPFNNTLDEKGNIFNWWGNLDTVVKDITKRGMVALLVNEQSDGESTFGDVEDGQYLRPAVVDADAAWLRTLASRYAANPRVWLTPLNEANCENYNRSGEWPPPPPGLPPPRPGEPERKSTQPFPCLSWTSWQPQHTKFVQAIRDGGNLAPVVLNTPVWAKFMYAINPDFNPRMKSETVPYTATDYPLLAREGATFSNLVYGQHAYPDAEATAWGNNSSVMTARYNTYHDQFAVMLDEFGPQLNPVVDPRTKVSYMRDFASFEAAQANEGKSNGAVAYSWFWPDNGLTVNDRARPEASFSATVPDPGQCAVCEPIYTNRLSPWGTTFVNNYLGQVQAPASARCGGLVLQSNRVTTAAGPLKVQARRVEGADRVVFRASRQGTTTRDYPGARVGSTDVWEATVNVGAFAAGSGSVTVDALVSAPGNTVLNPCGTAELSVGGQQLAFYPVTPKRIYDTRTPADAYYTPEAPLASWESRTIGGRALLHDAGETADHEWIRNFEPFVPPEAVALSGNVTAISNVPNPAGGFFELNPTGLITPVTSAVNFPAGKNVAGNFTLALGRGGAFDIRSSTVANVALDVSGYYAPVGEGALYYHPLSRPIRLLDTRPGQAARQTPGAPLQPAPAALSVGARGFSYVDSSGSAISIPSAAKVLVGNATARNLGGGPGYVSVSPELGTIQVPARSTVNFAAPQTIANGFVSQIGVDATLKVTASAGTATDFLVDASGYFSDQRSDVNGAGLLFVPLPRPIRLYDTRPDAVALFTPRTPIAGGAVQVVPGRGLSYEGVTIPSGATVLAVTTTAVNNVSGSTPGFATLFPAGSPPTPSTLNFVPNQPVANSVFVTLGPDGAFRLYSQVPSNFIVDVTGYFIAP